MSEIAFIYEGFNSLQLGFTQNLCNQLLSVSLEEYSQEYFANRCSMIAPFNNIIQHDPIEGYMHPNTIFEYVSKFSQKKDAALAFELAVIRVAKEILFQSKSEIQDLFRRGKHVELIKATFQDNTTFNQISESLLAQTSKAFLKSREAGHFSKGYNPPVLSEKFTIREAVKRIQREYQIADLKLNLGFEVNLDQFIARYVTPELIKISNKNSKDNLSNWLSLHPEVREVYALIGSNHLDIISATFNQYKDETKIDFEPIHNKIKFKDRTIQFHVFPDRHGYSHAYNELMKYSKKQGLKVPTPSEGKELMMNFACSEKGTIEQKYFTDQELSFLICNSIPKFKNYTPSACASIVDGNAERSEIAEACNAKKGKDRFWYKDLLRRGVCSFSKSDQSCDSLID